MKRLLRFFIIMVVLVGIRAGAMATEEPPLALSDVLHHAYLHNPTLNAARAELRATHERLPQAFAGWKPTIGSEASITASDIEGSNFGGSDGSTAKDVVFSLDQPLFRGGRTFAEVAAARYVIDSQHALLLAQEQDILLEAATTYMNVVRDQALLDLSKNTYDVIGQELEATKDRFDVGELTKTDLSQARARLARANSDVITARGTLNASIAAFVEVTGLQPHNLFQPEMQLEAPETLDHAILQGEETSPVVLSAVHAHRASEKDVDGVFGELLPEIGLFSSWNRTFDPSPGLIDKQTSKAVGLSASIPLYQAGAVRSRVREAKHTANQRYIEILEAKRQVRQEIVSNWADLQAAKAEIRSRKAQVEASRIAQEGVRAERDLGARTVLDTLDADQELLDAEVALVTAMRNEVVAQFALLSTLGLLTPQTLGFAKDTMDYQENLAEVQKKIFDMDVDRVQEVD